jgi:hypothetical protein
VCLFPLYTCAHTFKKKNFAPIIRVVVVTRRFVTPCQNKFLLHACMAKDPMRGALLELSRGDEYNEKDFSSNQLMFLELFQVVACLPR